jgi:hypothetical protein
MQDLYQDLCDISEDEGMAAALKEATYHRQECMEVYRMWARISDGLSHSERKEKENAYTGWQAAERFILNNE